MLKRKQMLAAQLFQHLLRAEESVLCIFLVFFLTDQSAAAAQPSLTQPSPNPCLVLGSQRGK